jgi:hypothetical protein
MAHPQPDWHKIGPMPSDPVLDEKLGSMKLDNDHPASDESVWIDRSCANAPVYSASESIFFSELDKKFNSI